MQMQQITRQLTEALGQVPDAVSPLTGGCVGEVYAVRLADGTRLVAKVDDGPTPRLDVEGFMLAHLAEQTALPVPVVHFVAPRLLVMSFLPGRSHFPARGASTRRRTPGRLAQPLCATIWPGPRHAHWWFAAA